jgi:hypothetical protein
MAGMNSFNNANGWADGTYDLAAGGANGADPERRHQLVIDGDAGDVVNLTGVDWANVGTVTHESETYNVYNSALGRAQVLVVADVTVNGQVPVELSAIASGNWRFCDQRPR